MAMNRDNENKSKFLISSKPEDITLKPYITFLGVELSDHHEWKQFLLEGPENIYTALQKIMPAVKKY